MNLENEIRKIHAAQDVQRKMLAAVLANLEINGSMNAINMIETLRAQMTGIVQNNPHSGNIDNIAPLLFVEEAFRSELDGLSALVSALKQQMTAG